MSNIYQAKGKTLVQQYRDVGAIFAPKLILPKKINKTKMILAERVLARVPEINELKVFYECFASWCSGLGVTKQMGMYLLADNLSGCQTAMVRYKSGVAMLHTEEDFNDVQARMIAPETVAFDDNGRRLVSLVYHDLMPGAGLYGWQRDMIVAVDSIWLREDGIEKIKNPMLANIVSWIVWFLKPDMASIEQVTALIKKLGVLVDGYAINVIYRSQGVVNAYKLTIARNEVEVEQVWDQPGDNLRQVNIIEPRYARAKKPVAVWRHAPWKMFVDYRGFVQRLREMKEDIQLNKKYLNLDWEYGQLDSVHKNIQKYIFHDRRKRYVNEWMGAACVGLVDQRGTSVSTKLNDKQPLDALEYVDRA